MVKQRSQSVYGKLWIKRFPICGYKNSIFLCLIQCLIWFQCGEEGHISRDCTNGSVQREQRPDRRMNRDDMRASRGSSGSRGESNANFSEIGVPSKWKVGAGFQEYAETLRHKVKNYGDFKKGNTANSRNRSFERDSRPKFDIKDRGIRRLAPIVMEEERENVSPDELEEEVDVMKAGQVIKNFHF